MIMLIIWSDEPAAFVCVPVQAVVYTSICHPFKPFAWQWSVLSWQEECIRYFCCPWDLFCFVFCFVWGFFLSPVFILHLVWTGVVLSRDNVMIIGVCLGFQSWPNLLSLRCLLCMCVPGNNNINVVFYLLILNALWKYPQVIHCISHLGWCFGKDSIMS